MAVIAKINTLGGSYVAIKTRGSSIEAVCEGCDVMCMAKSLDHGQAWAREHASHCQAK
jgi:hypothetical protein